MKNPLISTIPLFFFFLLTSKMASAQSTWPFVYEEDPFSDDAMLDLRYLNETYAGEHGFIRLSEDGNYFRNGEGQPVRFWAVNGGSMARKLSDEDLAYYARFLAKMGVNMIRYHGCISPKGKGTQLTDVDSVEINHIWRLVAAMKKKGIYTTISPFWAHNGHMGGWVPPEWGINGYSEKDGLWGVMYFNDRLKEAYKSWVKVLYTRMNPHTGISLKDDPAVGLIQIKNEDGLFFWTMQNIKPELKALIIKKFSAWLLAEYGSLDSALARWNGYELPGDDPENGILDIFQFYDLTLDKTGSEAKRVRDQVAFYAHTQFSFYKEIYDFYRDELGCRQLINANNWKTGDPTRLNDLERYTNTSCDVLAVNRYYSPNHVGENNGWRIDPGHFYKSISCLQNPGSFPLNIKQVEGHPMLVTESGWNFPQKYMAEAPMLVMAYMSLTGIDGFYWFCPTAKAYDENPYFTWHTYDDGQHPMLRWTYSLPGGIALFPANALSYRLHYVKEGQTIIREKRSLESLYNRRPPLIGEQGGFDPNRDQEYNSRVGTTKVSPLAYLTGPVNVIYDSDRENNRINDQLTELIDYDKKQVSGVTGQLNWDFNDGIFTLNTPSSKGACGFLNKKEKIVMDELTISSDNDYAAVQLVAMDERPLSQSEKILIQVGTNCFPSGWQEEPARFKANDRLLEGQRILNTGTMPWQCATTKITLELKNSQISRAILLNTSLYADRIIPLKKTEFGINIELPENTMYLVLD